MKDRTFTSQNLTEKSKSGSKINRHETTLCFDVGRWLVDCSGRCRRRPRGLQRRLQRRRHHAALAAGVLPAGNHPALLGAAARPPHRDPRTRRGAAHRPRCASLSRQVRAVPWRAGRGAGRHRQKHAAPAGSAGGRLAALAPARDLLDHPPRHQDERHASLDISDERRGNVGCGGLCATPAEPDAAGLCAGYPRPGARWVAPFFVGHGGRNHPPTCGRRARPSGAVPIRLQFLPHHSGHHGFITQRRALTGGPGQSQRVGWPPHQHPRQPGAMAATPQGHQAAVCHARPGSDRTRCAGHGRVPGDAALHAAGAECPNA